ncbi:hypothetical protein TNCV_1355171 [Trichonephila clavipes]|uniref:Uncharacterized protein n=1 Tax=Trichonephila clavipes TaxID=2585209 RepID=A0A8X6SJF8_TRICX|nr:hypothetical protein TNCV_1355171 [Trichonephila clavipes]
MKSSLGGRYIRCLHEGGRYPRIGTDCDPTIKQQSSEWKHPSSPTLKGAKTAKNGLVCQQFYQYFSDGMSPIEAIRFHENKFLLEDNFMGLANASINPTHNQIYYLHKC